MRDTLILEARRFTNTSALGKEIEALLESSDYKLEVCLGEKELEELSEEYESLRGMGRLKFKTLGTKQRSKLNGSLRYEIIDDSYRKYPDGRLVALDTRKGREWYREQVYAMCDRQQWICGLVEHGRCSRPDITMLDLKESGLRPTFEHADKRGLGGSRRDDNIATPGNCAVHQICNSVLGSERLKP